MSKSTRIEAETQSTRPPNWPGISPPPSGPAQRGEAEVTRAQKELEREDDKPATAGAALRALKGEA